MINKNLLDKIHCIECVEGLNKLPDDSVDLIIADPPYGISRKLNCKGKRIGTTAKLNFEFGEWDKFNKEWINISLKKTKGWFMSFCAKKDIGVYWELLEKNKFKAVDAIVWQKPDPLPLNAKSRFVNAWEVIVVGKKSGSTWNSNYKHNIIKYQAPKNKARVHPTQKPLNLIKELIEVSTKEKAIVCDPFIGSGTTAIACKLLNRSFIGFEISKEYCKMAEKRLLEMSSPNNSYSK